MLTLEQIGLRVAAARARTGLSREKFARLVSNAGKETTSDTLLNLEMAKGKSADVLLLAAIAEAAGVQLVELLAADALPADVGNPVFERFARVVATMGETEVEPHLRALELLAQERAAASRPSGKKKSA